MRSVNAIIVAYFVLWITGKNVEKIAGNAKIAKKIQIENCQLQSAQT
jgi:hypothetical protein